MSKELQDLKRKWRAKSQAHSSKFAVAKTISGLYDLGLAGTLIPHNWRNWLRRGNRCDIIACDVLALLCYLHRTFTDDYDRERTREDLKADDTLR